MREGEMDSDLQILWAVFWNPVGWLAGWLDVRMSMDWATGQ